MPKQKNTPETVGLEKSQALDLYRQMLTIRRFEEATERLYRLGKIKGFLHTYIGEEAIAVGSIPNLRDDDYVIGHYRDHGHALARGMDPNIVMAELYGKATGSSGGKGGSMHLFDAKRNFMGGYAIVGGQLPIAAGIGLGIKYRKLDSVVMCFFGDGAVNEGEFHETMNLAALWQLPIVFMLENNLYGMGTGVTRSRAGGEHIYQIADSYQIPAAHIDGMDIMEVREATISGIQKVRSGGGPVFIEAMAYRFHGHSMADPANYRASDEVSEYRARDPIGRFRTLCIENDFFYEKESSTIDDEIDAVITTAVEFAENSPEPPDEALYTNIYANSEESR
mgnify:CR=1 FL=1